jgi:hypothetical protein
MARVVAGPIPTVFPVMTLAILGLLATRSGGQTNSPAERAAKLLSQEFKPPRSIEVRDRTDITHHDPAPATPSAWDYSHERYVETLAGQRFAEYRGMKGEKMMNRSTSHLKGKGEFGVYIIYRDDNLETQKQVHFTPEYWMEHKSDRKQLPACLLFLFVGSERLDTALANATYLGESQVLGRPCNSFLFEDVRWLRPQDHVYHLDRETAIPLKVEAFADQAARDSKSPLWVWTAESLDEVDGRHFVLRSTQTSFHNGEPSITWRNAVERIEFDKEYPDSLFAPNFDANVTIVDYVNNEILPPDR